MATISLIGKVVCKDGEPPVSVKEFKSKDGSTIKIGSFSMLDTQRCYHKTKDDNPGQFYRVEVTGRDVDIASDRLRKGIYVNVVGQAVWRQYNGSKFFDVKNSTFTVAEDWKTSSDSDPF